MHPCVRREPLLVRYQRALYWRRRGTAERRPLLVPGASSTAAHVTPDPATTAPARVRGGGHRRLAELGRGRGRPRARRLGQARKADCVVKVRPVRKRGRGTSDASVPAALGQTWGSVACHPWRRQGTQGKTKPRTPVASIHSTAPPVFWKAVARWPTPWFPREDAWTSNCNRTPRPTRSRPTRRGMCTAPFRTRPPASHKTRAQGERGSTRGRKRCRATAAPSCAPHVRPTQPALHAGSLGDHSARPTPIRCIRRV